MSILPRIKLVYFAYLAAVGIMVTYLPYQMEAVGLTAGQIGLIFTGRTMMSTLVGPTITGWSDRVGRTVDFLRFALIWGFVVSLGLPVAASFIAFAAIIWTQSPGQSATIPLIDATIVRHGGELGYGRVRMWGSLGYGIAVCGFGLAVSSLDYDTAGGHAVWTYVVLVGVAAVVGATLPRGSGGQKRAGRGRLRALAGNPTLVAFLAINAIHWASVVAFNVFFALHTKDLGLSTSVPGIAILVMVSAEALAFLWAGKLLGGAKPGAGLYAAFGFSVLRWVATATITDGPTLIVVQLLHFFSFGIWFSSVMRVVGLFASEDERASLQGLLNAVIFGIGGVIGSATAGFLMDGWSGGAVFWAAAAADGLAIVGLGVLAATRGWRAAVSEPSEEPTG